MYICSGKRLLCDLIQYYKTRPEKFKNFCSILRTVDSGNKYFYFILKNRLESFF